MSDTVIRKTPKELHEQRARLIASTGLSEKVLRERGEAFQLYPEHQAVWDTVHGIDYLLDGAEAPEDTPIEEQPALVQVGWYCWRCEGLVPEACRSDNVPMYVPTDWEKDMAAEVERLSEDDEDEMDRADKAEADVKQLRAERDRYRSAWQSARLRAEARGEGILREVKNRDFWCAEVERLQAERVARPDLATWDLRRVTAEAEAEGTR